MLLTLLLFYFVINLSSFYTSSVYGRNGRNGELKYRRTKRLVHPRNGELKYGRIKRLMHKNGELKYRRTERLMHTSNGRINH